MSLRLISVDCWSPPLALEIERLPSIIGSNGGSDLLLDNRWTASRHCELKRDNGSLVVRAVGRKTEILVNGRSVRKAKIHEGDELTIGIRVFRIEQQNGAGKAVNCEISPLRTQPRRGASWTTSQ